MSDCNNGCCDDCCGEILASDCCSSSAPECSDIPLARDGAGVETFVPEIPDGGTRTVGYPTYELVVTNP